MNKLNKLPIVLLVPGPFLLGMQDIRPESPRGSSRPAQSGTVRCMQSPTTLPMTPALDLHPAEREKKKKTLLLSRTDVSVV